MLGINSLVLAMKTHPCLALPGLALLPAHKVSVPNLSVMWVWGNFLDSRTWNIPRFYLPERRCAYHSCSSHGFVLVSRTSLPGRSHSPVLFSNIRHSSSLAFPVSRDDWPCLLHQNMTFSILITPAFLGIVQGTKQALSQHLDKLFEPGLSDERTPWDTHAQDSVRDFW